MDCQEFTETVRSNNEEDDFCDILRSEQRSRPASELKSQFNNETEKNIGIHSAAYEDKLQEVAQSLDYGTSLYSAVEKREKRIIKLLLDGGADMTIKKRNGESPLDFARDSGDQEIIKMLTYRKIDVPADGSCLFWASTLAYLIPVRYEDGAFQRRFERLFGNTSSVEKIKNIQEIIQGYNTTSNYAPVSNNQALKSLVTEKFRNKVIDEMYSQENEFEAAITLHDILYSKNGNYVIGGAFLEKFRKEFSTEISQCNVDIRMFKLETFNETSVTLINSELDKVPDQDKVKKFRFTAYLECMRDPISWGGKHEIQAMSRVLHCNVNVFSDGIQHSVIYANSSDRIQLFNNGEFHYSFGLIRAPVLIEAIRNNDEQEAKTYLSFGIDDVHYKNSCGWTSLDLAAQHGYTEVVEYLFAQGAGACVRNSFHQRLLDVAKVFDDVSAESVFTEQPEVRVCSQQLKVGVCSEYACARQQTSRAEINENEKIPDQETQHKPATYKRSGEAGLGGQIYEIELSMLFLLQGITKSKNGKIESFHLATNLNEAEDFDDVVLKYKYKDKNGSVRSKMIFLQAKHKEHPNNAKERVTFQNLFSKSGKKGDFTLKDYFCSYLAVKNSFAQERQVCPIFKEDFADPDCDFIIYTNASSILSRNARVIDETEAYRTKEIDGYCVKEVNLNEESFLYLEGKSDSNRYYELTLDGVRKDKIIDILQTSSACKKVKGKGEIGKKVPSGNKGSTEITGNGLKLDLCNKSTKLCDKFRNKTAFKEDLTHTSLQVESPSETDIKEFLSKLKIFVEQPGEEELSEIIKQKIQSAYQVEENDANVIFSAVRSKVEWWWKAENSYLTESNTFFEESVKISIFFDIKKPADLFIGREEELRDLHKQLQANSGKITVISQKPEICGAGGIGKTELAITYVCKYSGDYDNNIIWINAKNNETLVDSFRKLAQDKLKINAQSIDDKKFEVKSVVKEVYKYFANRKCLFIFDDAENHESQEAKDAGINTFLPPLSSNKSITVLITSRSQNWDNANVLSLDVFTEEDAHEFIRCALNIQHGSKDSEVKLLSDILQHFPLALQQAAIYIREENKKLKNLGEEFSIDDYLRKYEREEIKVRMLVGSKLFDDNNYGKASFITWKIALEKVKEIDYATEDLDILDIIAYFTPNIMSTKIFFKSIIHERQTGSRLQLLRRYSSVTLEQGETEKHKLVEQVISMCLKEKKGTEFLRQALKLIKITMVEESSAGIENMSYDMRDIYYANYEHLVEIFGDLKNKCDVKLSDSGRHAIFYVKDPPDSD